MARPTKLDEPMRRALEQAIEQGLTVKATCALLRISPAVFYGWAARGRNEAERREDPYYPHNTQNDLFIEFLDTIDAAKAQAIRTALDTIQSFAQGFDIITTLEESGQTDKGSFTKSRTTVTTHRDWRAAAWIAERLDPENYGRTNRTVLSSDPQLPVEVHHTIEEVDVAALTRVVAVLADAGIFPGELAAESVGELGPGPDPEGPAE